MARGLLERRIPLLVNGSLDTKSNPKLVKAGELLELTNMYQLRTGEMRPRNGFSRQSATDAVTGENLFVTQNGGLGTIAHGWKSLTTQPLALKYGTSGATGWEPEGVVQPHPMYTARVSGVSQSLRSGVTPEPALDPDMIETGGFRLVVWTDGSSGTKYLDARETTTGRASSRWAVGIATITGAIKCAVAGSNQSAIVWAGSGNNLKAIGYTNSGTTSTGELTIAADLAGSPSNFFDIKAIPGTGNIAVAYKASGGGIKCGIFNPATGVFATIVATAGGDATFCIAFLDDQLSTGNMYVATAGSVSGVVVRTMSATTMVVSATNVIDATATANVRNITGHLIASAANYMVLWDVTAANAVDDTTKQGVWTGAASVQTFAYGQSLYSRTFRFSDGTYYALLVFGSAVQGSYQLVSCDTTVGPVMAPVCIVLSGEAAGRRQPSTLASPLTSSGVVNMPVLRNRKIATPVGDVVGGSFKTASVAAFSPISKVTHARELGGTTFIPGGLLFRDDGNVIENATFPFYPEVPTGTSSNAGGSMTASGSYSYRTVRKAIDATGRITRSAGSVPFTITLGAADNRVTLTTDNSPPPLRGPLLNSNRGGFGSIFTEIYRRGPAASGATLYNKVGEHGDTGGPVTFVDTMSDATAALGEAAYFNGNVLENFNPPSHSLLEVNGSRVGIVSAEEPTEFWYSKEYKAGAGIGFNPLLKVAISGDGAGGMTALASMDGRWILFKKTAIYVLSGDGPDDLGRGSFNQPQAVSRSIGTTNPSSVIETPDGIMFQATDGRIWLIGRDMGLSYIGAPVESDTLATTIVGAALHSTLTTVRFVLGMGLMFEWDYYHKKWYRHQLDRGQSQSGSVVDCANSPLHGWCYLLDTGDLVKEIPGQTSEVVADGTLGIVPVVSFPHLQFANLAGYQRLKTIDFTIDVLGSCTVSVDAEYDFSGALTGTPKTFAVTAATPTIQLEYNPPEGKAKGTSVRPVITVTGSPTGGTFRLTGATATIGVKRGSNVAPAQRMT